MGERRQFLAEVARVYYENVFTKVDVKDYSRYAFVFPNRRAGLFFKKYLADLFEKPVFSPAVFTISEFFALHTSLRKLDDVSLLFRLYDCYKEVCADEHIEAKPFAQFMSWGEMLLSDFNEVDNAHADAKRVFTNVADLKEIDELFFDLSDEVKEALKQFWTSVLENGNDVKKNFATSWKLIYPLYEKFTAKLRSDNCGYEGLVFRDATINFGKKKADYDCVVFAGFNALNENELALLDFYNKEHVADFYWDSESMFFEADYAGHFVSAWQKRFKSKYSLQLSKEQTGKGNYHLIPVASEVGQAFQINRILQEKGDEYKDLNTAVVLPDETMLLNVLHNIPNNIPTVNVTMGYALQLSQTHSLVHNLLQLQENAKKSKEGKSYCYFKYVLPLLNHPLIERAYKNVVKVVTDIVEKRLYNVHEDDFEEEWLQRLLQVAEDPLSYVQRVIEDVHNQLKVAEDADNVELPLMGNYMALLNQLARNMRGVNLTFDDGTRKESLRVLRHLIDQLVSSKRIAFDGEPLAGLQVIGLLETRALDFENLIIPSMNEDIYPKKQTASTTIPYNLRKAFRLLTYEDQDKVSAYYFFRLISRAKNVHILYDTRTDGNSTGEASRFVQQLKMLYSDVKVEEWAPQCDVKLEKNADGTIFVEKTPEVMDEVLKYAQKEGKGFSASALKNYMKCPLRFYLCDVVKICDQDELKEDVAVNEFGSIYHLAMELLYKDYVGKEVTKVDIAAIKENVPVCVKVAFNKEYLKSGRKQCTEYEFRESKPIEFSNEKMILAMQESGKRIEVDLVEPEGQYKLITSVIEKYVQNTLDYDGSIAPFIYEASEDDVKCSYEVEVDGKVEKVNLHGFVDRIHLKDGIYHVVDYKTGSDELKYSTMDELFNNKKPNDAVFQTLMYSLMLVKIKGWNVDNVQPNVYKVKKVRKGYEPMLVGGEKQDKKELESYGKVAADYERNFKQLLERILSKEGNFAQAEVKDAGKSCEWCPFMQMCGVQPKEYGY